MTEIQKLQEIVSTSDNIVFFGGAGVSTESGIPDFRSMDGIYNELWKYPPETILSHTFFSHHPKEFFDFYKMKMIISDVHPNAAHCKLVELEQKGILKAVITQNIDGLHQNAGSQNVIELHGSVRRNYCLHCGKFYDELFIKNSPGIPICTCGGTIKPDVVLYEEELDQKIIKKAIQAISETETLIIGGTSLIVYPAAGLIDYFKGKHLVLINQQCTQRDGEAALLIHGRIGEVLSQIYI